MTSTNVTSPVCIKTQIRHAEQAAVTGIRVQLNVCFTYNIHNILRLLEIPLTLFQFLNWKGRIGTLGNGYILFLDSLAFL